ncbi:hypothetical protein RB195_018245 [Necator americanus]|uniref:Uncharacterized protein n=1 Tax=Necator americanus TaxID=51031 RepID=A0ABR1CAV6_NECAM
MKISLFDDMDQPTTAAVRTSAGCTSSFELVTEARQGQWQEPSCSASLFAEVFHDTLRKTCTADIDLATRTTLLSASTLPTKMFPFKEEDETRGERYSLKHFIASVLVNRFAGV